MEKELCIKKLKLSNLLYFDNFSEIPEYYLKSKEPIFNVNPININNNRPYAYCKGITDRRSRFYSNSSLSILNKIKSNFKQKGLI